MVAARRPLDPGRRPRPRPRRRLLRLIGVALLLSVLVLAVNSVVRTSAEGPDQRLAFVDQVRPAIDESTRQGAAVTDLRQRGPELGAAGLRRNLDRLVDATATTLGSVHEVDGSAAPEAKGLLVASLAARHAAVRTMTEALSRDLGPGQPVQQVVDDVTGAGRDMAVGDRAYELFVAALPEQARAAAPPSRWVGDPEQWQQAEVAAFVASLRAEAALAPVHDVAVVTVSVDPAPVGRDEAAGAAVLPATRTLTLDVVVANVGNEPERRVAVEAVATSVGGLDTARQFVDLEPGQRRTVRLELRPAVGDPLTVSVRAGPVAGEDNLTDNELQPPLRYVRR